MFKKEDVEIVQGQSIWTHNKVTAGQTPQRNTQINDQKLLNKYVGFWPTVIRRRRREICICAECVIHITQES